MNMAKATEQDLEAALLLLGMLMDVDKGHFPRDIGGESPETDPEYFDSDSEEHLREFHKRIMRAFNSGGVNRVIWGMHTVLHNDVLNPDSDVLALHPKFAKAEAALLKAKEIIKAWHGDLAWDIYDRLSPEMKQINEAIEALK